jgi:hypothetical protein
MGKEKHKGAGDVAQVASTRPQVQIPVHPKKRKKKTLKANTKGEAAIDCRWGLEWEEGKSDQQFSLLLTIRGPGFTSGDLGIQQGKCQMSQLQK